MSTTELIAQIIGYIIGYTILNSILGIPIILLVLIIKGIKRAIKKKQLEVYNSPTEWKSEWTWNEETKLWEHPKSKKTNTEFYYTKPQTGEINTRSSQHEETPIIDAQNVAEERTYKAIKETKIIGNYSTAKQTPQIIYTYPKSILKTQDIESQNEELDFENAYQKKSLFTRNEWQNYKKLRKIAEEKGYVICPKVRLFDLIEPRVDKKKKLTYRYKIQAKHVDFIICDQDMHIKAIIELDDNSHYDPERIKRDEFVNTILQSVGYTVIHTLYIENNILDLI